MKDYIYNREVLNNFASGMADLQVERNPLATEVIVIFNTVVRDQYQDSVSREECRVKKRAMVKKNIDMNYVQQYGDLLLEESESLPWIISMTTTSLPRNPKLDDQILIDGRRYNVSGIKPSNRSIDSLILVSVYPERNDYDPLKLYSITDLKDGYMDILYGGKPLYMSYSLDGIADKSLRIEFDSRPKILEPVGVFTIFDDTRYSSLEYDLRV